MGFRFPESGKQPEMIYLISFLNVTHDYHMKIVFRMGIVRYCKFPSNYIQLPIA